MTNAATQSFLDYPLTLGKRVALEFYHWRDLDRVVEALTAPAALRLAQLVDSQAQAKPVCALLKGHPCPN